MDEQMNRGAGRPNIEFSTLVEILRWRALQQPEQRIYTYLLDGETEGDSSDPCDVGLARPGALRRCSKATEQAGSVRCCFIQQVSSSSPRFSVAYMPG